MSKKKEYKHKPVDQIENDGIFTDSYGERLVHGNFITIEGHYVYSFMVGSVAVVEWDAERGMYKFRIISSNSFYVSSDFYGVHKFKKISDVGCFLDRFEKQKVGGIDREATRRWIHPNAKTGIYHTHFDLIGFFDKDLSLDDVVYLKDTEIALLVVTSPIRYPTERNLDNQCITVRLIGKPEDYFDFNTIDEYHIIVK